MFHNELEYLSMGMSGDYRCDPSGATMVRVGSAIFGAPLQLKKTGARLRWEAIMSLWTN